MVCSFAIVIQQLPPELRDPVCIFYLVLRALDTVEDDMAIPVPDKLPTLLSFHEKIYDRSRVQRPAVMQLCVALQHPI